jgi:flavodoxin I
MKAFVVYDSEYGNTQKVAEAIGAALGEGAQVVKVGQASAAAIGTPDLLVVGGPTYGGRPRPALQEFLKGLSSLGGVKVAAFDTRVGVFFAKIFGYAAPKIAKALEGKGGKLVAPPEPFIVMGKEGPLKEGELERAAAWAKGIAE